LEKAADVAKIGGSREGDEKDEPKAEKASTPSER
jgi:hypothetical protein